MGVAFVDAALTMYALSGPEGYFCTLSLAAVLWVIIGVIWLIRGTAGQPTGEGGRDWRWVVVPAVFTVTVVLCGIDLPSWLTFEFARPKLEAVAQAALAHPTTQQSSVTVGPYGTCQLEVDAGTVYISVPTGGFDIDSEGFAYNPTAPPRGHGRCRHLSGPWYHSHLKF